MKRRRRTKKPLTIGEVLLAEWCADTPGIGALFELGQHTAMVEAQDQLHRRVSALRDRRTDAFISDILPLATEPGASPRETQTCRIAPRKTNDGGIRSLSSRRKGHVL
jgi:hypothetical protein